MTCHCETVPNGSQSAMREREADELAEEALVNNELWARAGFPDAASSLRIVELAMEAKVHPAVVAGRVRFRDPELPPLRRADWTRRSEKDVSEGRCLHRYRS